MLSRASSVCQPTGNGLPSGVANPVHPSPRPPPAPSGAPVGDVAAVLGRLGRWGPRGSPSVRSSRCRCCSRRAQARLVRG